MDRTQLCGSCNVGSIPAESTNTIKPTHPSGFYSICWLPRQGNRTVAPIFNEAKCNIKIVRLDYVLIVQAIPAENPTDMNQL